MLTCSLPICCKYTGDDTICPHKELPRLGLSMCQKFLSHSRPRMPHVMYQDAPLIASSAARYGNTQGSSLVLLRCVFHSSISHRKESMMREGDEFSGKTKEKYVELTANSHAVTREMSLRSNPSTVPQGCRAVCSPDPLYPHVGEGINKWCCCRQFCLRLVEIQPKPALYFLQDP